MKFYLHKDSLLLQVKASGSKVDNLIDKMKDLKEEATACIQNCIKAIGPMSGAEHTAAVAKCSKQCLPADVLCGFACRDQVEGAGHVVDDEVCTTESSPCYKCLDKCANGAGAVAATGFAVFFSLAIASFMM